MNRAERRAQRRRGELRARLELAAPPGEVPCRAGHYVLLGGRACPVCGAAV